MSCKHKAQAYIDSLHSSESAEQASVCTIWKAAFALLLSLRWCCVTSHQSFSLISTWQLCRTVLLFRQSFLLWYLLYRQFLPRLFLFLPQFVPFAACYFIWTSFFCFTLQSWVGRLLHATVFTHWRLINPLVFTFRLQASSAVPQLPPIQESV